MAASLVTTTTEFLQGRHRQKHFFQKHSASRTCQLLWGTLHSQNRSSRFFNEERVSLRCSSSKKMPGVVVLGNAFTSITKESKQGDEASSEHVIHFYRIPLIQESVTSEFLKLVQTRISSQIVGLKTEQCFNVGLDSELSSKKLAVLKWLLQETCQPENLGSESFLAEEKIVGSHSIIVEVVPRLFVTTAWSANAASICKACGLVEVKHLERVRRYLLYVRPGNGALQDSEIDGFAAMVHDQITERFYIQKQTSFKASVVSEEVQSVQAMDMGLAFDEQDNQYYSRVFRDEIKQNPTAVKLFDIAESNTEHSRPWSTLQANPCNSVIGFMDNSKAIKGFPVKQLRLVQPGSTCTLDTAASDLDILCTTGSHNFPCAVAPYSAGASGHTSDTHATGGGSFVAASTASFGIGNLGGNNSNAPWEDPSFSYPSNPALPLQIFNDARNGSSDNGDKFRVPLIQRYTRSFGQIDHTRISKEEPDIGMLVVKVGGAPCHLGMRGGAAPNMASSQNYAELDFDTVQHGDAAMTKKLYRVVQACIKMGEKNPIITIQDEGDGGICNVIKEIICPKGADIDIRAIVIAGHKMYVLEIRGAEYEGQDAILVKPESREMLQSICERERVSMAVIGIISGEGCACLLDDSGVEKCIGKGIPPPAPAVDLETEEMLCGEMPQECSDLYHLVDTREPLDVARGEVVVMAVPKKRTSKSKTRIRRNCWLRKGQKAARYAFSLAKSISTGKSKSFMLSK